MNINKHKEQSRAGPLSPRPAASFILLLTAGPVKGASQKWCRIYNPEGSGVPFSPFSILGRARKSGKGRRGRRVKYEAAKDDTKVLGMAWNKVEYSWTGHETSLLT